MNTRNIIIAAVALLLSLTAGAQATFTPTEVNALRKLQMAEYAINNLYVDSVNMGDLTENAIRGMLNSLDPHSSYSPAKQAKSMMESLQGSFEGIGVQFNMDRDTLLVIQTITNGPSEKVGILAGDRIVSVNDTAIAGVKMSREEIMHRLRGKKGTQVKLGVVRRGISGVLTFNVIRDKIPLKTIDAFYMIRPKVGYIRISRVPSTRCSNVAWKTLSSTCRTTAEDFSMLPHRSPTSFCNRATSSSICRGAPFRVRNTAPGATVGCSRAR